MSRAIIRISFACLLILALLSITIGRYPFKNFISEIFSNEIMFNVIFLIRIPRILFGILVGFGLASSGLIMQKLFKNPLAEPGILGVNQAAGFGAALGILVFESSYIMVQVLAFIFGFLSIGLTLFLSNHFNRKERLSLVLAGISISALFSAGLGLLKYIADPLDQLPSIVFWLLGSLSNTNWSSIIQVLPILFPSLILVYLYRWRLNMFSLDKEVLFSLDNKNIIEFVLMLVISVLITSSIISLSGIIGWVGLIIPNITRLIVEYDTQYFLPLSMILGGIFVLVSDNFARALLPGEIPLGIITAFIGAVVFFMLLIKVKDLI